jgi:hypothetical protein
MVNISVVGRDRSRSIAVGRDGSVPETRIVLAIPPGKYSIRSCQLCTADGESAFTDLEIMSSATSAPPSTSTPAVGPTPNAGGRGSRPFVIASVAIVALAAGSLVYRRLHPHPVVAGEELTFQPYPGEPLVQVEGPVDEGPSVRLVPDPRLDRQRVDVEDGS